MFVAINLDELWLGAKNLTNLVIAGFTRNVLKYSFKFIFIISKVHINIKEIF